MPSTCSDCGQFLGEPIEENANYVSGPRWTEPTDVEVVYGLKHTDETQAQLDELTDEFSNRDRAALAAEAANPDVESVNIATELFTTVEVQDVDGAVESNEIAYVYTVVEERDVQKTALLCGGCVDTSKDDIIWGPEA